MIRNLLIPVFAVLSPLFLCGEKLVLRLNFPERGSYAVSVVGINGSSPVDTVKMMKGLEGGIEDDSEMLFAEPVTSIVELIDSCPDIVYPFETTQEITGQVITNDGAKNKNKNNTRIVALNCQSGERYECVSAPDGSFTIPVGHFAENTCFNIEATEFQKKRVEHTVNIDRTFTAEIAPPPYVSVDNITVVDDDSLKMYDADIRLREVSVTTKKPKVKNRFRIDTSHGYFNGDPAIARYPTLSSLLRSIGVYSLLNTTIVVDDEIIQRSNSNDTYEGIEIEGDDFNHIDNVANRTSKDPTQNEGFLNNIVNTQNIWQVEYIKNDPRTAMFHSAQNNRPVLLIYTRYFDEETGRTVSKNPCSFYPEGFARSFGDWKAEDTRSDDEATLYWNPDVCVDDDANVEIIVDASTHYDSLKINIEGISVDGGLMSEEKTVTLQ